MICDNHGITLVVIPYWWNRNSSGVADAIHTLRPDFNDILRPFLIGERIPKSAPNNRDNSGMCCLLL